MKLWLLRVYRSQLRWFELGPFQQELENIGGRGVSGLLCLTRCHGNPTLDKHQKRDGWMNISVSINTGVFTLLSYFAQVFSPNSQTQALDYATV